MSTEWTPRRKRAFGLAFDLEQLAKTHSEIAAGETQQAIPGRLLRRRDRQLDNLAKSVERFFLSADNPGEEHPEEWA